MGAVGFGAVFSGASLFPREPRFKVFKIETIATHKTNIWYME
jgi:hypothetical protein